MSIISRDGEDQIHNLFEVHDIINDTSYMTETINYALDMWRKKLLRIIRRNRIKEGLKQSVNLSDLKKSVRDYEQKNRAEEITRELTTEEFSINEAMIAIADELVDNLKSQGINRRGFAIVLIGSSVHGGLNVRNLTSTGYLNLLNQPDFDFGIVADRMDSFFAKKVMKKANAFLKPNELSACDITNPENLNLKNIRSTKQAKRMLKRVSKEGELKRNDAFLLYFQPSFPAEINKKNRKYILEALKQIYNEDKLLWERIIPIIMIGWQKIHNLKEKHIPDNRRLFDKTTKDSLLKSEVVNDSRLQMQEAMHNLLKSTGVEERSSKE